MALQTLTELVKINDENLSDIEGISDLLQDAPFLAQVAATEASNGTNHSYLKETEAPSVGFRAVNAGRPASSSKDTVVEIALKILDAGYHVDSALADKYKNGRDAYMSRESMRHMRAAYSLAEKQIIYGTGQEADGFTGMADASTIDSVSDPMVVNAGSAVADSVTSVYLVRSVGDMSAFALVAGNDGNLMMPAYYSQLIDPANNAQYFNAYVQPIQGWMGVQVGSQFDLGRIANIGTNGSNGLTDVLISEALSKFPAARPATHLVMNRTAHQQLQASRTTFHPTGQPAPFPTDAFGVPIVVTDSIVDTEPVLA